MYGLSSKQIRERFLTEKVLKQEQANEIATGMEATEKNLMRCNETVTSTSEVLGLVKQNRERKAADCIRQRK